MKVSPKMKQVIAQLAEKHEIDVTRDGAHFRLEMPGYDRLCVTNIGYNQISVAHYFERNGHLVPEPDVVFFIAYDNLGWIPIEIAQSQSGWTQVIQLSDDGKHIVRYNRAGQQLLAEFAEQWAQNIADQGWLEYGQLHIVAEVADKERQP